MSPLSVPERQALVESVRDLAWQFVNRLVIPRLGWDHEEDAFQECMAAAAKSATTYDPAVGVKFVTYSHVPMKWAALQYVYARERDGKMGLERDPDLWLDGEAEDAVERADEAAMVLGVLAKLPAKWRRVVRLRFGLDGGGPRSRRQVAALIGCHRNTAHEREQKALRRLRHLMGATA